MHTQDPRRRLPSVNAVLADGDTSALIARYGRGAVRAAVREALETRRLDGESEENLHEEVARTLASGPVRVLNATGVILNTNLGRAPLADRAIAAMTDAAGYAAIEWDQKTGERGSRDDHLDPLLRELTGAEAGIAVNTNAGAVLLALAATASPGEVLVSRGQLIEIGGGFRVPEILELSGCRMVEVGTTNKTRIDDYARARGEQTTALLRVHPANFTMGGFVESTPLAEMVALATEHGLPVIDDLGSGLLDRATFAFDEPGVTESVDAGADLVCFSADKLLGGPQAGIVVGKAAAIGQLRRHPLARALRLDKLRVAALRATLQLHRDPAEARREVPALRALAEETPERQERARALGKALGWEVVPCVARVGGGALPGHEIASFAVVAPGEPEEMSQRLRELDPPVVGRISGGKLLLDVAALSAAEAHELPGLLRQRD
jgi:L-seryl-tRNA(Ser) seleniumtransferase